MLSALRSTIIPFILRNSFRKEIILILSLKLFALFAIWGLFFSHPVSKQLKKTELVAHFVSLDQYR